MFPRPFHRTLYSKYLHMKEVFVIQRVIVFSQPIPPIGMAKIENCLQICEPKFQRN